MSDLASSTPGLTSQEAAERVRKGMSNTTEQKTSRTYQDIFVANFLSIANVILLSIVIVLLAVGKAADAGLTGGAVILNIFIGTFQEIRAKQKLDKIAILTRPKVTVLRDGNPLEIDQSNVVIGDALIFKAGDQAVVDGTLITDPREGESTKRIDVDESALTGESDLIAKYPGDEILSGCFCVVGQGIYMAEKVGNGCFARKMTAGAREYTQVITPLQRQISIIVRLVVILAISLAIMLGLAYAYQEKEFTQGIEDAAVIISLVPQGLLLMITVAYALGALRIARKGALVQQSNAVESLSNVNVLCLDKTGTLTTNRILFDGLHPLGDIQEKDLRQIVGDYIASMGAANRTAEALQQALSGTPYKPVADIPFSSARKWAGASFEQEAFSGTYIMGAPEMVAPGLTFQTGQKQVFEEKIESLASQGLRVLVMAYSPVIVRDIPEDSEPELPPDLKPLGLISFSDELRPNVREVLDNFRRANVKLCLISGDNPQTVAALAYHAGFSPERDLSISGIELENLSESQFAAVVRKHAIFGRITPEQKKSIVEVLKQDGYYVAMMGDGVNDVLSLKQAQVGIAMEDGSQATRSVADIVLLGNKFEVLPEAFMEGQRILNGMNDSMRLFLTRTLYTILLIIIAGFIGTEFPFTPRHNALLTTLPVGIPVFFLAIWAKTGQPRKSLLRSVAEFVLPAGFSLMVVTVFLWILYVTSDKATIETGRTVLTTAALLGGFWLIIMAEHEREVWQDSTPNRYDPRRIGLTLAMLAIFALVMAVPDLRKGFELTTMSWADLGTIAGVMAIWATSLYLMWRYNLLERLLIPDYGAD